MTNTLRHHAQPPLVIHTDASRSWGGQEIRVLTELIELRGLGFQTALIARENAPLARRAQEAGVTLYTLPTWNKLHPATWPRLGRLIKKLAPAVLNTHSSEDSWTAAPLARALGVPLVLRTRHVSAPVSSTFSYRFPHCILACSEAIAAQLAGQGLPPERIVLAPTGNDAGRFRFSEEKRREMRSCYRIAETDCLLGNVGFLRDYKGQAFILNTLAALDASYKLMLVGDGELRQALEAQTASLGLEERVFFVGHQERPEDFYHAFDIFFFSSRAAEGVSQALVQALLNGLPVLACDLASNIEVLRGVGASRVVPYGAVAAARKALGELKAFARGDAARAAAQERLVAARYGLPVMMARLEALYARFGIALP